MLGGLLASLGSNVAAKVLGNAFGVPNFKRFRGGAEAGSTYDIARQGMGRTLLGGALGIGGGIADAVRQRRSMREARQALDPFTDPLYGFRESRAMLDAANQMGTANLAQLAQRMGGSQGAAQAAGAEAGSQAMTNAYLGALESGRNMAFQATQAQNAFRPTTSVLGGALGQAGGLLSSIGGSMLGQAGAQRDYDLGAGKFTYTPQQAVTIGSTQMTAPGINPPPMMTNIGIGRSPYPTYGGLYNVSQYGNATFGPAVYGLGQ